MTGNEWLLTRDELEKKVALVTGVIDPTDMVSRCFALAMLAFAWDMVSIQNKQTIAGLMEKVENQAITISNKDGGGIVMFTLEDWVELKKEMEICKD